MQEKLDFLRSLPIFADLTDAQLVDLAQICVPWSYKRGSILAYQGDAVDNLFIVRSGRLETFSVDKNGIATPARHYEPGDYFEDIWLFIEHMQPTTIRAMSDGELYTIHEDAFFFFLEDHPRAILDLSEEAWDELDRSVAQEDADTIRHLSLLPGELIEYQTRRTKLLLFFELTIPLLFMLIVPTAVVIALQSGGILNQLWVQVTAALLLGLPPLLLAIYRYVDWANDFLWMTTKHLVHREFDLRTISVQTEKVPIDRIQSIRVEKPTIIETFLGVGTVRVTTAAQDKGIKFDKISNPGEMEDVYNRIRMRERSLNEGRTRSAVRGVLRRQFSVPDNLEPIQESSDGGESSQESTQKASSRCRVKRRGVRVEDGTTITYGKHWFVLVFRVWWVVCLMLATVALTLIAWNSFPAARIGATLVLAAFVLFLEAAGYYYLYEDWANDVFQLTNDTVIDIDRGPFGLTETRKTAQISNVQNVRTVLPNFVAAIFNFGDVVIDTAGASAEIVFEDVANPTRVQTEIFERRESLVRTIRNRDASGRREEIGLMLEEYRRLRDSEQIHHRPLPPIEDEF